jgi:hypothetical protein
MMGKLPKDEIELRKIANKLGVITHGLADSKGHTDIAELQSRIINTKRSIREGRLWIIALVSATASVLSAIAAWFALLKIIKAG